MKNQKGKNAVVNYIIHYTGRPVMAESRIIDFDEETKIIHYYYEDHKTEERIEVKEQVIEFMKKLVQHIPEPRFKMIRYCGLYATCNHNHKNAVKKMREKSCRVKIEFSYRRELIETFDTDPLLCSCGSYMEYIDYWVPPSRRKMMTMKTVPEEFEDNLIAKDDYIEMKCTNCGYEEEMPDWVYGEEALFLREEGITDPPCELTKMSSRFPVS